MNEENIVPADVWAQIALDRDRLLGSRLFAWGIAFERRRELSPGRAVSVLAEEGALAAEIDLAGGEVKGPTLIYFLIDGRICSRLWP